MKVLVTGGTGFIGSHLLNAAMASGHDVIAVCRQGSQPRIPLIGKPRWITADLAETGQLFERGEFRNVEVLIHLAAAGVLPRESRWASCYRANVLESTALWESAVSAGVRRIVACGSCFEYGGAGERYERIPVNCPLEPIGPYASSKAAATVALTGMARAMKFEAAVVRPFHVFGKGEDGSRLWPSLRAAALAGADYSMTPGEQVRDMMAVESLAKSFLDVAVKRNLERGMPEIHNVGSGVAVSIRRFAESWWSKWNAQGRLLVGALEYRPDEVMRYVPELTLERARSS